MSNENQRIVDYYRYQYDRDINHIVYHTFNYFSNLKKNLLVDKPVIIFDIDDTLLSNYPLKKKEYLDKSYCMDPLFFPPIEQIVNLFHLLIPLGYHLIIITGRFDEYRDITIQNLKCVGIYQYDEIHFRKGPVEKTILAKDYKLKKRKEIMKRGYTIVGNIGDQWSDLEGEYSGHVVKIPNPQYVLN